MEYSHHTHTLHASEDVRDELVCLHDALMDDLSCTSLAHADNNNFSTSYQKIFDDLYHILNGERAHFSWDLPSAVPRISFTLSEPRHGFDPHSLHMDVDGNLRSEAHTHSVEREKAQEQDNERPKILASESCKTYMLERRVGRSLQNAQWGHLSFVKNSDLAAELDALLLDERPQRNKLQVAFAGARARVNVKSREDAALLLPVDLKSMLLSSAQALGRGDAKTALEVLQQVQMYGTSPCGSGLQRTVHYFREALLTRISGMGNTLYVATENSSQLQPTAMALKTHKIIMETNPCMKLTHFFANQCIFKAAKGALRVHIVDYGILYGFQWPSLIYALAHRSGGPPFLRITGVELQAYKYHAGRDRSGRLMETGRQLMEYANSYSVPFEYNAISISEWEDNVAPSSLRILPEEVLVLSAINTLHYVHTESIVPTSFRDRLLEQMRSLNPRLLVTGVISAQLDSPFFISRFREALHFHSSMFDIIHTTWSGETPERELFESAMMGRAIMNVVACEGFARVECPETHTQWQKRLRRAGFRLRPIKSSVLSTAHIIMKAYHKDYSLLQDLDGWMLLGWRGRFMQALSAWEPAIVPQMPIN